MARGNRLYDALTVEVELVYGRKIRINTLGQIDNKVIKAFTYGQCHAFALALHNETSWPIYGIGGDDGSPSHCLVYCPKLEEYIDIEGIGAKDRWEAYGSWYNVKLCTPEEVLQFKYYREPNIKVAEIFVKPLLAKLPL